MGSSGPLWVCDTIGRGAPPAACLPVAVRGALPSCTGEQAASGTHWGSRALPPRLSRTRRPAPSGNWQAPVVLVP